MLLDILFFGQILINEKHSTQGLGVIFLWLNGSVQNVDLKLETLDAGLQHARRAARLKPTLLKKNK